MKIFIIPILFLTSLFCTSTVKAAGTLPLYKLSVSFDIERNLLKGNSTIILPEDAETDIFTGSLRIMAVKLNGRPLELKIKEGRFKIRDKGTLEISYEGVFRAENIKENPENVGVVTGDIISNKGISLTGTWYPFMEGMSYYSLRALIPRDFIAVSEADGIVVTEIGQDREYSFNFPYPVEKIHLIAGRYKEVRESFNGMDICGYFFPEDLSLAKTYIEHTKKYFKLYDELLLKYPYKRFSIVENFLPTGYSMPTFTLLGQDVVRLPFIVETSLGHEILHQWFGNLVYVDYEKGNWSEGLTTYLSDHLYKEQEGKGWEYRKQILIDYESYVIPEKEFPLKDFTGRVDFASKAIGYGKGAMFFHMLKNLIGDDLFYTALKEFIKEKKFQEASWDDLNRVFERASGKNLHWFFDQWLLRTGIISMEIKDAKVEILKGVPTVSFEIIQKEQPFRFDLPVKINTEKGEITEVLHIEKGKEAFEITTKGLPREIIFDGNYNLMRRLSRDEYPPVISRLLGDEKRLLVIPGKEIYADLIEVFKEAGFITKEEKDVKDEDITTSSLLLLGSDSPVLERLFGRFKGSEQGFTFTVKENPLNISKVIAIADGNSKEEINPVSKKIFHYGRYSYLKFEKGQNIDKKIDKTKNGIIVDLYRP
ncbi:MAG: M1 family aminopeptidase, partial [Nitrospirota bacterium]